jgi:Na+/melibiose symporter-like transporter
MMPAYNFMLIIYAALAFTTILIAWNPSFKVIRLLGSDEEQGKLTSIRMIIKNGVGLLASSFGVYLVSSMATERDGMRVLLMVYSSLTILGGLLVLFFFKPIVKDTAKEDPITLGNFKDVLKIKNVWLIGLFGFGIYLASTSLVYLQPYMKNLYGLSTTTSSVLGVCYKQMQIIAAPVLTLIGTKVKSITKVICVCMAATALCFIAFLLMPTNTIFLYLSIAIFLGGSFCVMGSWAIQYLPLVEIKLPVRLTGSAIGVVSIIAYLTDTFYFSLCGYWIDSYEMTGYHYIFMFTIFWMVVSAIAAFLVVSDLRKRKAAAEPAS